MIKEIYSALYDEFHPVASFFPGATCKVAWNPKQLPEDGRGSILILHGGADISPTIYNKKVNKYCHAYEELSNRDGLELALIKAAKERGMAILGICRGAQILCAAAGGSLIQHVDGHAGKPHLIEAVDGGRSIIIGVNSYHHQMMNPEGSKHEIVGKSLHRLSQVYWDDEETIPMPQETEAVFFNAFNGLGVQWHPEWLPADHESNVWLKKELERRFNA